MVIRWAPSCGRWGRVSRRRGYILPRKSARRAQPNRPTQLGPIAWESGERIRRYARGARQDSPPISFTVRYYRGIPNESAENPFSEAPIGAAEEGVTMTILYLRPANDPLLLRYSSNCAIGGVAQAQWLLLGVGNAGYIAHILECPALGGGTWGDDVLRKPIDAQHFAETIYRIHRPRKNQPATTRHIPSNRLKT